MAFASIPRSADAEPAIWTNTDAVGGFGDETLFVVGNILFAVYHEFGHALIDLLGLPVIGREEDAVDGFAALTMIPEMPDPVGDALIVAVADGWRAQSDVAAKRRERYYWGEHALDEQRHFAVVCLMVGSDQDGFYDYALEAGLPRERIGTCSYDFKRITTGWKRLLDPHRPETQSAETSINLMFDQPLPEQAGVFDLIQENGLLEDALLDLGEDIILPSPVTVRFTVCEEANAYWSRSDHEVKICYELVEAFQAILQDMIAR